MLLSDTKSINSSRHSSYTNLITAKSVNIINGIIFPVFVVINTLTLSVLLIIFGLFLSPTLFILSISFFAGCFLIFGYWLKPRLERNSEFIANILPKQMKFTIDLFGSFREITINRLSEVGVKKFGQNDKTLKELTRRNLILSLAPRYFLEPLVVVMIVSLAIAVTYGVIDDVSSITFIGVMAFGLQRFLPIFQGAYTAWSNIQSDSAILDEVLTVLRVNNEMPEYKNIENRASPAELIVKASEGSELLFKCRNMEYGYPDKDILFSNVNIEIKKGDRIAIVGESGSGKSTLADIIMGIIRPTSGELIYLKYKGDASNPFVSYWKHLAYVPQDIRFFNDTLANNINLLGDHKPDKYRLSKATEFASLQKLIDRLDHGLDQRIHDDGSNFSGGERQRIGLARALYKKDTNLMIFDEPTSALDRNTSDYILDKIKSLGSDIAVVVITHDKSILHEFNKIYKLEDSRLESVSRK